MRTGKTTHDPKNGPDSLRLKELATINALTKEMAASLSLSATVHMAYDLVQAAANPDLMVIFLVEGDRLISQGERPELPEFKKGNAETKKTGDCLCGLAATEGKPLYVYDILKDSRCSRKECKLAGIRSFAAIPLLISSRVVGVFGLGSFTLRDFSNQAAYIETLAGHIAMGIRTAKLQADINTYAEQLEYSLLAYEASQNALQTSEEKYRSLFENLQEGIWGIDAQEATTFVNPSMAKMLGYSAEEMVGMPIHDFVDQNSGAACCQFLDRCRTDRAGQHVFELIRKDGTRIYSLVEATPLFNKEDVFTGCVISVMDITKRKTAEENLQRAQYTIDHAMDAVFWLRPDGRFFYVNHSACKALGYDRAELTRMSVQDIDPGFNPETWPAHCGKIQQQGSLTFETDYRTKDGRTFPVEITANHLEFGGQAYVVAFARDIAQRKQAEKEKQRLQAKLSETQKLEAIATLAGGIAHQFNNVLSTVSGSVELIEMDNVMEGAAPYIYAIKQSVARMTKLTNQLLSYARGGRYKEHTLNINDFIKDIIPLVRHRLKAGILIETVPAPEGLTVRADPTQLQMVLSEVLFNASEAIETNGSINIKILKVHLKERLVIGHTSVAPGLFACIKICDDGHGMATETLTRMFEPFYTTKFQGRGLGMAAAFGIVCNHGGWISTESEAGRGTTVLIHLPAVEEKAKASPPGQIASVQGKETILLVDDEEAVLAVSAALLEKLGYQVLAADTGQRAVDLFKQRHHDIDVVVLDLIMPHMGGGEVFDKLKAINPGVPVLLSSGFNLDGEAQEILARGCRGFIQKPFSMEGLSSSIREVLDKPS